MSDSDNRGSWTLLTGHGHVLVAVARNPEARIRDISTEVSLTERATLAILADLESAGYVTRTRMGRRTRYTVHLQQSFRHTAQGGHRVGPFLALLAVLPESEEAQTSEPEQADRPPEEPDRAGKPARESARRRR